MKESWTTDSRTAIRQLAVEMVLNGEAAEEMAEACGVSTRTLQRWVRAAKEGGVAALADKPRPGRPTKLDGEQAEQVLGWLEQSPDAFGLPTERWTAPRLAWLIERRLGVRMHPRYLNDWLRRHGVTPQMPQKQAAQRDEAMIRRWLDHQWPAIKKKRGG